MDCCFRLLGTGCRITSADEPTSARLRSLLHVFEQPGAGLGLPHALIRQGEREGDIALTFRGEQLEGPRAFVVGRLVALMTATAIESYSGFAVHAGVVATGGQATVLAAASGVGKSTLTAACLQAGFGYLSDEALCVAPGRAEAEPFPKPIALGEGAAALLGLRRRRLDTKDLWTAEQLGARSLADPVPIRHVVALRRSGHGRSAAEPLPTSTAVAILLGMSFNAHRDRVTALATAAAIARQARAWAIDVGDPRHAARVLRDLVAAPGLAISTG